MSFGKCPGIARQTNGQIVLAIAGLDLQIGYFHRRTIATLVERHTRYVSSDAKIERLKLLGADFTLNYTSTPDWELSGRGVDLVVRPRSGARSHLSACLRDRRLLNPAFR